MGRSPCCDKNALKKGPWTTEEDTKLINYIQLHGPGNWRTLPNNAGLQRCGKSCRLRWANYLRPDIKRGRFSFEEEETIIQLHSVLGNKWSAIAARLPGRTDNEIKNYWNTHIRKRLLRSGIDPVTHERRLDQLDLSSLINSQQLNLSNLIHLNQQPLINPEVLRLALSLGSLINSQNSDILLQNLQENRLINSHDQLQNHQAPAVFQLPNPFENNIIIQQIPPMHDPNLVPTEGYIGNYNTMSQEYYVPVTTTTTTTTTSNECHPKNIVPIVGYDTSDQMKQGLTENSSYISSKSSCSNQNVSHDSVLSTPLSSPPHMNGNAEKKEMKSFCNAQLYRFESLNFDDFM